MKKTVKGIALLYANSVLFLSFIAGDYGFAVPALVSAPDTLLCLAGGALAAGIAPAAGALWGARIVKLWRKLHK